MGRIITIPYKPRVWARPFHASFKRWAVLILHRRIGKTTAVLNHHQRAAIDDDWETRRLRSLMPSLTDAEIKPLLRHRFYGHIMPSYKQAKTAAWDMLKYYARDIEGAKPNESELLIRYANGARVQLFGADNPDALRGIGFSGVSHDEFSQQPREIFSEVISKALADHLGYAIFSGTIKGRDHLYKTHEAAKDNAQWFSVWQDIDRSIATEDEATVKVLQQAMQDDLALVAQGLMTQDEFDQEWFLSADAAIQGAWFSKELAKVKAAGQITRVPYDPALAVDTDWDLGVDDAMAIWFSQSLRSGEVRLIDYYENSGEGFPHYIGMLRDKPYTYGKHYPPHDIEVREMGSGKSRKEVAAGQGLRFEPPPTPVSFIDGIDAARLLLPRCWFDESKTMKGLEALRAYRKMFNARLNEFTGTAVHNWASHGADAFRGLAVRHQVPRDKAKQHYSLPPSSGPGGWMSA